MSKARQHTQGEWTVGTDGDCQDCRIGIWSDTNDLIAAVANADGYAPGQQGEENARLIAAAPDLLHACEQVLGWITATPMGQEQQHAAGLLRDAIARARGE